MWEVRAMSEHLLDLADWLFYLRGQMQGQVHRNDPVMKNHEDFLERSEKAVRMAIETVSVTPANRAEP